MSCFFEKVLCVYFFIHIPMIILLDSQIIFSKEYFPDYLINSWNSFMESFKDPYAYSQPLWYKAYVYCEVFIHLPYFVAAIYAFTKGNCPWIRIPSIMWSTHVLTACFPTIYSIINDDFSRYKDTPVPETLQERYRLAGLYSIFAIVPCLLLVSMLLLPNYGTVVSPTAAKKAKKN